ncbi:hypothetical protein NIES4074_52140 [Cylindrospermum sp. NIES-4074]|nr:hypothetical protein NIES4074_52140 [Cylindrospermum sp. NIES-4074]
MSRHKIQKPSFENNGFSKKSSSWKQANSWTNPYEQSNVESSEQPINTVKPLTTEEWLKDNIMLKVIETRKAQLLKQQLEENSGAEQQQPVENIQMKCAECEAQDTEKPQNIDSEEVQLKEIQHQQKQEDADVQLKISDEKSLEPTQDITIDHQKDGELYASNPDAMRRGNNPLNADKCNRLADEMEKINAGNKDEKGARQRENELLEDKYNLYEEEQKRKRENTFNARDVETWTGHEKKYQKLLDDLKKLVDQWEQGQCDRHNLKRAVVAESKARVKRGVPKQPRNYQ